MQIPRDFPDSRDSESAKRRLSITDSGFRRVRPGRAPSDGCRGGRSILGRPTDFFGTEPLVQRFQVLALPLSSRQLQQPASAMSPDELLIDSPGIENASPLDIEALADDQPGRFPLHRTGKLEGVTNKINWRIRLAPASTITKLSSVFERSNKNPLPTLYRNNNCSL